MRWSKDLHFSSLQVSLLVSTTLREFVWTVGPSWHSPQESHQNCLSPCYIPLLPSVWQTKRCTWKYQLPLCEIKHMYNIIKFIREREREMAYLFVHIWFYILIIYERNCQWDGLLIYKIFWITRVNSNQLT